MRVPSSLTNHCIKALSQSMDNGTMTVMARRLLPGYDLHKRTGIPKSVAIPNRNAASQIVRDIIDCQMFLDFVLLLFESSEIGNGIAGRKFAIPYLRQILSGVQAMGYLYDHGNRIFVENPNERKTRNWGTLKTQHEYTIAFLRIDIAGNTRLVRKYERSRIEQAYSGLREIIKNSVERRNGRIWSWDGDGGLAAFCYGNMHEAAALSGIEILHELFLYNRLSCPIEEGLDIRLAAHSGPVEYSDNDEIVQASDSVRKVAEIEHKHTQKNSITVSEVVKVMLEPLTSKQFTPPKDRGRSGLYSYRLRVGKE